MEKRVTVNYIYACPHKCLSLLSLSSPLSLPLDSLSLHDQTAHSSDVLKDVGSFRYGLAAAVELC